VSVTDAIATGRDRVQAAWERIAARLPPWLGGQRGPRVTRLPMAEAGPALGVDRLLCGAVLSLTALGVVMVFSAGAVFAAKRYGDWTYFLKREAVYATLGVLAFWFGVRTDYAAYRRITYPLLFACLALLAAVLVVGSRAGGAIRWFRVGPLSFQPSEMAKFSLALYLASLLARKAEKVRDFSVGFLPPLVVTGAMMALLLKQPDLGTAAIFGVVALAMLFVAGTRTSYILLSVLVAAPVGWQFIVGTPWRMRRMLAFLDPWAHRQDAGYQVTESLISIGSGGVWGVGLGAGRQKLFFLPEAHTDFILAVTGEELGLVGLLGVLAAFGLLVWRGLVASSRARDAFGSYLAFGITAMFGLQGLFNMAVVMGLLPTKGLPLPFVSYGGTSLIMSLFAAGVVANVSARNPVPKHAPLFGALRWRWGGARNRRAAPAPRIVVEIGRRPRRVRAPAAVVTPDPPSPPEQTA
jgi:cell division protein FtsW